MGKPGFFEGIPKEFLPGYKGPCFMIRKNGKEVLRCLPHFYIIGITKCGTTELWEKLKLHPQLSFCSDEKESEWWTPERNQFMPFSTYLDLRSAKMVQQFQRNESLRKWLVTADGSPTTIYEFYSWRKFFGENYDGPNCTTADLLYAAQPQAKIIITLRDPIDRLYSHYLHFNHEKGSVEEFHEGVVSEITEYEKCRTRLSARACAYAERRRNFVTLNTGLYSVFIRDWAKVFPWEQIRIQRLDDWRKNCPKVYSEVLKYLELDSLPDQTLKVICTQRITNSGAEKLTKVGAMMNKTRQLLVNFYAESNRKLSKMLGDDRYLWKQ
nr:carbohydrate sulfotransferase 15-like [Lytechinus pictus]